MLLRAIIFFTLLIGAAIGVDALAQQPGALSLSWYGWSIETSAAFFVVCVVLLLVLVFALTRVYIWLDLLPKRIAHSLQAQRREKGLTALSDSMTALSIGDRPAALKAAKSAKKALPHNPLADAMLAQASAWGNPKNRKEAISYYSKLLDNSHTDLAGLKGLLQISIEENNSERALTYAQEIYAKSDKNEWVMETLTDLYARNSRYEEAAKVAQRWQKVAEKNSRGYKQAQFTEVCNRLEAAKEDLRLAPAHDKSAIRKAEQTAEDILKIKPDFVPAGLFLADVLEKRAAFEEGRARKKTFKQARKVLRGLYKEAPRHQVANRWVQLMKDEPEDVLVKRAEKFIGPWDDNILGMTTKGKALVKARQWTEAHKTLSRALLKGEDRTLFEVFAQLEQAQHPGGGGAVRWLERALDAPEREQQHPGYVNAYQNWRKSLLQTMAKGRLPHPGDAITSTAFQLEGPDTGTGKV